MLRPSRAEESDGSPSQLPAPYAPPWKRLGEDAVAIASWAGLKLRELWRRNGEGSLPLPSFWPRRSARLFWPTAIATVLLAAGLLFTLGLSGIGNSRIQPGLSPSPEETILDREPVDVEEERKEASVSEPAEETDSTEAMDPGGLMDAESPAGASGETNRADAIPAVWTAEDPEHMISAISSDADTLTLTFNLNPRFLALPAPAREQWAQRWQGLATELGYNHLQLTAGDHRLVGRDARVGGGMILYAPSAEELQGENGSADAGGSPARTGEGDRNDGVLGNRTGGAGGSVGGAPNALSRRLDRLLPWRHRGVAAGADGGEHRQPPVAER